MDLHAGSAALFAGSPWGTGQSKRALFPAASWMTTSTYCSGASDESRSVIPPPETDAIRKSGHHDPFCSAIMAQPPGFWNPDRTTRGFASARQWAAQASKW